MMTLREQLQDPIFKKWFSTPPRERVDAAMTPPWYVYVQTKVDGPWARAEFKSWKKGYKWLKRHLKDYHDMSLTHKRQEFQPPVVREGGKRRYHLPPAPGHIWCGYCRRMTRFAYFGRHHAFGRRKGGVNSGDRRCSICGIRLVALRFR
jgi:hypothetical protein